jgi:hypothetical protein
VISPNLPRLGLPDLYESAALVKVKYRLCYLKFMSEHFSYQERTVFNRKVNTHTGSHSKVQEAAVGQLHKRFSDEQLAFPLHS